MLCLRIFLMLGCLLKTLLTQVVELSFWVIGSWFFIEVVFVFLNCMQESNN